MNDFCTTPPSKQQYASIEDSMMLTAAMLRGHDATLPITLVYHNDTDGLCSGVIMAETLKKMGRKTTSYCYEQIYPVPLFKIYKAAPGPIAIMDLGIGRNCLEFIRKNTRSRPTIILDHHESDSIFVPPGQDKVYDINCTKYGIDGDVYSSASTLAYMVASKMLPIPELSHLAVLGAFGDKNHTRGEEKGRFPKDGLDNMAAVIAKNILEEDGRYHVKLGNKDFKLMETVVEYINLLGSIGYRKKGSDFGISKPDATGPLLAEELLMQGFDEKNENDELIKAKNFLAALKKDSEEYMINRLREEGCEEWDNLIYFNTLDFFKGMGVKTVGTFCSKLISDRVKKNYNFVKPDKYLMGAQLIEPVPFGDQLINAFKVEDALKISIRAPELLEAKIKDFPGLKVSNLLSNVNPTQVGSSHGLRGATIVTKQKVINFLNYCELYVYGKSSQLSLPELDISAEG